MIDVFPEFAVPYDDAADVERILKEKQIFFGRVDDIDISYFTFIDDVDFCVAGRAILRVYSDTIGSAILKSLHDPLSFEESVWADWEVHNFKKIPALNRCRRSVTGMTSNDILDLYSLVKKVADPKRRNRAMEFLKLINKKR